MFFKKKTQKGKKESSESIRGVHLDQILPYLGYDEEKNILVSRNGDISRIFELKLPLLHSRPPAYYEGLVASLGDYIGRLQGGYIVQRLDFISPQPLNVDGNKLPLQDDNTIALVRHFNVESPLHSRSFLILTKKSESKNATFLNQVLKPKESNYSILEGDTFSTKSLDNFNSVAKGLAKVFTDISIGVIELKANAINKLIFEDYLSLGFINQKGLSEKDYYETNDLLHVGDKIIRTINLYKDGLPNDISAYGEYMEYNHLPGSFMNELYYGGHLPKIVCTCIYKHDDDYLKAFLKDNRRGVTLNDKEVYNKEAAEGINQVIDEYSALNLVSFHYGVVFIGDSYQSHVMKEEVDNVIFSMRAQGMDVCENIRQNLAHFMSYLPAAAGSIPMVDRCILPAAMAAAFPMNDSVNRNISYQGVPFKERLSGNLLFINIINANTTNKTILIFGASGTGKSFTVNYLLDNFIMAGHHVIVSDLGYSYKKLAEYHRGINMECTKENPLKLNPFSVLSKKDGIWQFEDELDEDFLIALFFTCWAGGDKNRSLDNVTSQTLSKLIRNYMHYCNQKNLSPNYDAFYTHAINGLEKDKEFQDLDIDKAGFKLVMGQFCKKRDDGTSGRYGYLFDENASDTSSMLQNRFVIFELENIKNDKILFTITYFILSALVVRRLIQDKHKRGDKSLVFVLDECWMLLSGEYGNTSGFIDYCVRTFRKHKGTLIIITQSVSDIADNKEIGEMVIKSSSMKFLKKQIAVGQEDNRRELQAKLNMSDYNRDLLFSIDDKFKEIYMEFDGVGAVMRIDVAPHQYWLYTSSPDDNNRLNEYRNKAENINIAIKNLLDEQENKKLQLVSVTKV